MSYNKYDACIGCRSTIVFKEQNSQWQLCFHPQQMQTVSSFRWETLPSIHRLFCIYSLSGLFNEKPVAPLLSLSTWKRLFLIRLPQSNRCFHQVLFTQMTGGTVIEFSSEQKLLQSGLQRSPCGGWAERAKERNRGGEGGVVSVKQPTTTSLEFLILSDPLFFFVFCGIHTQPIAKSVWAVHL